MDDASTDSTPQIAREYADRDPRIRLIRHDVNRKLPAALNTGFRQAAGRYFTWISDDNRFRPQALERLVRFLDGHPEVAVVYSDFSTIDEDGHEQELKIVRKPAAMGFRENIVGPCFLYRRRVHEEIGGYPEDLFLVEDYYFWLRAADLFRLHPLHDDLYLYRIHSKSLSQTFPDRTDVAEKALERALKLTRSRALQAGIHFHLAADFLLWNMPAQARSHLLKALIRAPWVTLCHAPKRQLAGILVG